MGMDSMIPVSGPLDKYDTHVCLVPSWVPIMWVAAGIKVSTSTHEFLNLFIFGTNNNFF